MRIISGKYRGMTLAPIKEAEIRPTADRVKESLFNILYPYISGAKVLDLFCGSGNLGIECLSRGAEFVHFNDLSKDSIGVLKKNLLRLRNENFIITQSDFTVCLMRPYKYDLIFIDPPYAKEYGVDALKIIAAGNKLTDGGIAVYERDRSFTEKIDGLELFDERKYGKTYLSFFRPEKRL